MIEAVTSDQLTRLDFSFKLILFLRFMWEKRPGWIKQLKQITEKLSWQYKLLRKKNRGKGFQRWGSPWL